MSPSRQPDDAGELPFLSGCQRLGSLLRKDHLQRHGGHARHHQRQQGAEGRVLRFIHRLRLGQEMDEVRQPAAADGGDHEQPLCRKKALCGLWSIVGIVSFVGSLMNRCLFPSPRLLAGRLEIYFYGKVFSAAAKQFAPAVAWIISVDAAVLAAGGIPSVVSGRATRGRGTRRMNGSHWPNWNARRIVAGFRLCRKINFPTAPRAAAGTGTNNDS